MLSDDDIFRVIQANPWICKEMIMQELGGYISFLDKALKRLEAQHKISKEYRQKVKIVNKINRIIQGLPPIEQTTYAYFYKARR